MAVQLGRRAIGIELNEQYFENACYYAESAEHERRVPTLFDLVERESAESAEASGESCQIG